MAAKQLPILQKTHRPTALAFGSTHRTLHPGVPAGDASHFMLETGASGQFHVRGVPDQASRAPEISQQSSRPVRVVHWAPQFASTTGTGTAIAKWIESLTPGDLQVTVVAPPKADAVPETSQSLRVTGSYSLLGRLFSFWREIRKGDLVHLHGGFDLKLSAIYLILTLERILRAINGQPLNILLTPHGALSQQVFTRSSWKKNLYWYFLDRALTKQIDLAICTTPREARELCQLMPHVRTEVVPLVIEPKVPDQSSQRTNTKPRNATPILCTLGRYDINMKGLDLLIGAVRKLHAEGFPVKLRCIGYDRNHGTQVLDDYVKSVGAEDLVERAGPKFGEEKERAIQDCDLFCMSSRYESFSYALMEGLESGLPVLVGAGACVTSFFSDEQKREMVVAPEADAWAAAIRRLLPSPAANLHCVSAVLENLRHRCAPERVGESLKRIYQAEVRPHRERDQVQD